MGNINRVKKHPGKKWRGSASLSQKRKKKEVRMPGMEMGIGPWPDEDCFGPKRRTFYVLLKMMDDGFVRHHKMVLVLYLSFKLMRCFVFVDGSIRDGWDVYGGHLLPSTSPMMVTLSRRCSSKCSLQDLESNLPVSSTFSTCTYFLNFPSVISCVHGSSNAICI